MIEKHYYYLHQAFILGYVFEIPGCIGFCLGTSLVLSIENFFLAFISEI